MASMAAAGSSDADVVDNDAVRVVNVRCVNANCERNSREFVRATELCRDFYHHLVPSDDANKENRERRPDPPAAFVCTKCVDEYLRIMSSLSAALRSGQEFDLTALPIFASRHRRQAVIIADDEEPVRNPIFVERPELEDGLRDELDDVVVGVTQDDVDAIVESALGPIFAMMIGKERAKRDALRVELAEMISLLEEVELALSNLRREKAQLDVEFPRRILIHCHEIDADESERAIPAGDEGGAGSLPPLWASKENAARASEAGVTHLIRPGADLSELDRMAAKFGQPRRAKPPGRPIGPSEEVVAVHQTVVAARDLPPVGVQMYPELQNGFQVFAADERIATQPVHEGGWAPGTICGLYTPEIDEPEVKYLVQVDLPSETAGARKQLITCPKRWIAYASAPRYRVAFGTRVIASLDPNSQRFYPGTVTEPPSPVNQCRYLVFFDMDRFQYCTHSQLRLITEVPKAGVWEQCPSQLALVLKRYVQEWPERPMLKLSVGDSHDVYSSGRFRPAVVKNVDASLALFQIEKRDEPECESVEEEWIYRGSSRLKSIFDKVTRQDKAKRSRGPIPVRSTHSHGRIGGLIQYTNADVDEAAVEEEATRAKAQTARKSSAGTVRTGSGSLTPNVAEDDGRVVKVEVNPVIRQSKFRPHVCSPTCWGCNPTRLADIKQLQNLEKPSPFLLPLKLGFTRHAFMEVPPRGLSSFRYLDYALKNKSKTLVIYYTGPCGRKLPTIAHVHRYLRRTELPLSIDMFLFAPTRSAVFEFVSMPGKFQCEDLTKGLEAVPISCVNLFDAERPAVVVNRDYAAMRVFDKGRVKINTNVDYLVCCDCTDDCSDPKLCACQQLTEFQALDSENPEPREVLYKYRRLESRVDTGIFECNHGCSCKKDLCFNRVAQNPISVKLQLFKTEKKKWGVRALHDLPSGCFVATYAGQILTSEDAQEDGQAFGDDYLAELDFIQINERAKEDYEPDVETSSDDGGSSEDEGTAISGRGSKEKDGDREYVAPAAFAAVLADVSYGDGNPGRVTRKRTASNRPKEMDFPKEKNARSDPRSKSMTTKSGYTPLLRHYNEKNPYVMDAKKGGNIGKYFNHSCEPNMFVQNVFVDTHDPRFHWLALFTSRDISAGEELCWDYGYDVGAIPGRKIVCHCGTANCRGRLL